MDGGWFGGGEEEATRRREQSEAKNEDYFAVGDSRENLCRSEAFCHAVDCALDEVSKRGEILREGAMPRAAAVECGWAKKMARALLLLLRVAVAIDYSRREKNIDDGNLSREHVEMVMERLGISCNPEDKKLLETWGSSEIDNLFEKAPSSDEMREAFDVFDEN
ncbi:hypothetical protein F0562_025009 [Nyssa sinensis]|uniref:EF-hand domain-containing protein n=1 Tax=Nyssa sinensis TaxID=561372 RepID=A0A5J5BEL5_9ASTE|nr:hypothetical protein F0562_025009 [Nyssa sinensis]